MAADIKKKKKVTVNRSAKSAKMRTGGGRTSKKKSSTGVGPERLKHAPTRMTQSRAKKGRGRSGSEGR